MLEKVENWKDGMIVVFRGVVTTQELVDSNDQLLSQLKKHPYKYQLVCFFDIDDFIVSTSELMQVAQRDVAAFKVNPVEKVAIVCDSPLIYGVARMYDAFAFGSNAETQIFETLDAAEIWLSE